MTESENQSLFSSRFSEALVYALCLHGNQTRKGSQVPYFAHLLAVTSLVLENGAGEDEAIAALLHDAVEDQGGLEQLLEIERRFGKEVACIILCCSDATALPKPPWRARKLHYLEKLRFVDATIRRISLADKLHNARSLLSDLQREGESVWKRFNGGREGTLWYYRQLSLIYQETGSDQMTIEFARLVSEVTNIAVKMSRTEHVED